MLCLFSKGIFLSELCGNDIKSYWIWFQQFNEINFAMLFDFVTTHVGCWVFILISSKVVLMEMGIIDSRHGNCETLFDYFLVISQYLRFAWGFYSNFKTFCQRSSELRQFKREFLINIGILQFTHLRKTEKLLNPFHTFLFATMFLSEDLVYWFLNAWLIIHTDPLTYETLHFFESLS